MTFTHSFVLALAALLVLSVSAQAPDFTASFELRHPFMQGGAVDGTMHYSWGSRAIRYEFAVKGYFELFEYNSGRGYAQSDKPFLDQWIYKDGQSCQCETGPLDYAMPELYPDSPQFQSTGNSMNIGGRQCQHYTRVVNSPMDVTDMYHDGTQICSLVFDDLRELTFTSYGPLQGQRFNAPVNCRCGKPVDLVMVLDRSGSISPTEFKDQKGFVQGFAEQFSYGPLNAAFSIVHFNKKSWSTLSLTEGITDENVIAGVNDLKCCNDPNHPNSCCCCGTSVSAGIRLGADNMAEGRSSAAHVLVVITDGYHNHDYTGNGCHSDSATCRGDLSDAVAYAKSKVPDIIIYAVGVGADRDVSMDELLIVSDDHPERILRREDFADLANDNLELMARACQENIAPCGGCCGFCVCGVCEPPTSCDSDNFCEVNAVPDGASCCRKEPRKCDNPTGDLCKKYECDETLQECVSSDVPCKPNSDCFTYQCVPATGQCNTQLLCQDVPECTLPSDCDDQNACTTDECVDNHCKWTEITCNDDNACTEDSCLPSTGCKHIDLIADFPDYCDDNNVCTVDTCDPAVGCVNEFQACEEDGDLCTDDTCDPLHGCLYNPVVCEENSRTDTKGNNCGVDYCEEGFCRFRETECGNEELIIGSTLATGAIVGIIIAIVACLALGGGGGAYALTQASGTSSVAPVSNNPIYVGSGSQGTNPLYQVAK